MDLVQKLTRLGGVATPTSPRPRDFPGASSTVLSHAVTSCRDAHGRYALPVADDALRAANRLSGVVSHRSAALHWGWEVKTVPERPDVTVRRKRHLLPHQADGVDAALVRPAAGRRWSVS